MARRYRGLVLALLAGGTLAFGLLLALGRTPALARAGASTRFVAPGGQDAGPCTRSDAPCATPQFAVDQAVEGDEVRLSSGIYPGVHARGGTTQALLISRNIILSAGWDHTFQTWRPDLYPASLDAEGQGRGLVISGTIAPSILGLRVTGGGQADHGGGVYVVGAAPIISGCTIYENAAAYGGGLYLERSAAILQNSAVLSNSAEWQGGGLYLLDSPATLSGNRIAANQAQMDGGGLYLRRSAVGIVGGEVVDNEAQGGNGGGMLLASSPAAITATKIAGNSARAGGGLYLNESATALHAVWVSSNQAAGNGGGLYLDTSDAQVAESTISENRALGSGRMGGGIYGVAGRPVLTGNTIRANQADYGGGLALTRGIFAVSHNSVISNTAAVAGGGLYLTGGAEGGPASIVDNLIGYNVAGSAGGGIYLENVLSAALEHNVVQSNTAATQGGGVFFVTGQATLAGNTIAGNQATAGYGGGLYLGGPGDPTRAQLTGNRLLDNAAVEAGGGMLSNRADISLDANVIAGNRAIGDRGAGGGLYLLDGTAALSNTVIARNQAASEGSGVYADGPGYRLVHTTLVGNTGAEGSAVLARKRWSTAPAASASLTNTIVAGQQVGVVTGNDGSLTLAATLWGSGTWSVGTRWPVGTVGTSSHDIEGDPGFVAPARDDYHLDPASAAIDRGLDAGVPTDLDGQHRPYPATAIPDLGADEYWGDILGTHLPLITR